MISFRVLIYRQKYIHCIKFVNAALEIHFWWISILWTNLLLSVNVRKKLRRKNVWNEKCHKKCDENVGCWGAEIFWDEKMCGTKYVTKYVTRYVTKYVTFSKEVPNNAKRCTRQAHRHRHSFFFIELPN